MLDLQRVIQSLWLAASLLVLYSNYVHQAIGRLAVCLVLWLAMLAGTLLLSRRPQIGVKVSAVSALVTLLVAGAFAASEMFRGIPHGPRREGNPLVIFEAAFYIVLAVLPAVVALLLSWHNFRRVAGVGSTAG